MFSALFAGTAAVGYGVSNFLGGVASKRLRSDVVTFASQVVSLILLAAVVGLLPGAVSRTALLWGAAAGLFTAAGILTFYRALATGTMGVIAPLNGVVASAAQVLFGLSIGERPSLLALLGVAGAVAAITLVAPVEGRVSGSGGRAVSLPVALAVFSGLCFAGGFICLSRTPEAAGLWPLLGQRAVLLLALAPIALPHLRSLKGEAATTWMVTALGAVLVLADVAFLLAVRAGQIAVVGPIVAMAPVIVILLARTWLHERLTGRQSLGILLSLASVLLVSFA